MNRTSKQSVERLLRDVWSQGDVTVVPDLIAERYTVFHDPGDPWEGQVLDQTGYAERVLQSRAPFPDQSFAIQSLFAEDGKVAVTWMWKGTHRLPIAGIAATNRIIRMSGATVYSFVGQAIVGHWQISDRLGVFQQLTAKSAS